MQLVKIILVASKPGGIEASGEVKAVEISGLPTIAYVKTSAAHADTFAAAPGRHSFHFRVSGPGHVTLSTEVDGVAVGPPRSFDATIVTAGRRYNFEVPA